MNRHAKKQWHRWIRRYRILNKRDLGAHGRAMFIVKVGALLSDFARDMAEIHARIMGTDE